MRRPVICCRVLTATLLAVALCSAPTAASAAATAAGHASPRTVTYPPVPDPHIPDYQVTGTFPVVSGAGTSREEKAISHAFAVYSATYRASALPYTTPAASHGYPGYFSVDGATTVANSVFASTIVDMETLYPGGNDGGNVFSTTALANGSLVSVTSLFTSAAGLAPLARLVKAQVLARYACVRQAEDDTDFGSVYKHAFDADRRLYAHFAITPRGLLVGFDQGAFADEACGSQHALIGWGGLRSALSRLGTGLVAAATASSSVGRIQ